MSVLSDETTTSRATMELPGAFVQFRPLMAEDLPRLEWHGGPDLRSFYREQESHHKNGEIEVVVADFNGFPIGQAAIHWNGKPTHPQIPDIQSVRVHPIFRRLGIGSYLIYECEVLIAKRGHPEVSLSVAQDNDMARHLYERLGYVVTGTTYSDVWFYLDAKGQSVRNEETVWDMVKELKDEG